VKGSLRLATLIAVLLAACRGSALVVTRGPYLQSGTATSIVVCWRTDVPTDSRVRFGTVPDALTASASDVSLVRDHAVVLTGLKPATAYWYRVGTAAATLAGDASHRFVTAPPPGAAAPLRFWVVGDSGTADANALAVRAAFDQFSAGRPADLWLMLGDDAYTSGTDGEFQKAVFETYPLLLRTVTLWSAYGNHDSVSAVASTGSGPYFDAFVFPKNGEAGGVPSGTEAYYAFDRGDVHFIALDSTSASRQPGSPMLTWLAEDLERTSQGWIVAFWHHPPYTKGSHDSDAETALVEMRQNVLPVLEAGGVDLVLAGHSHSYERSFLLDGHYGPSNTLTPRAMKDAGDGRPSGAGAYRKPPGRTPHAGAVYAVVGSSGLVSGGRLDHPAMVASQKALGSLVVDVGGDRLDAVFLRATGATGDSFSIVKSRVGTSVPAVPRPFPAAPRPDGS